MLSQFQGLRSGNDLTSKIGASPNRDSRRNGERVRAAILPRVHQFLTQKGREPTAAQLVSAIKD